MTARREPEAAKIGASLDVERRLELAAELLAQIAVRVVSERGKTLGDIGDAETDEESDAAA